MPWEAGDATKHKKGLSEKEATKWARIANAILDNCVDAGKSVEDCEASAIRIANSKVGK